MAQHKVRMCKYHHGKFKNQSAQNFTVNGNTEGAIKEYLQKKHKSEEITVLDIQWAT
jgi:hypothetical protein